ncbi:type II toxin-antitoxin system RelE/ParE family toxin [Duganella sp. FT80W]|uniref:Type II toxin-antitoxin system RelE/ParE family toxin n=1 Tax=Duganella guangzhouensis TaxID=2666084 RepID=A0A6I2L4B6_9BURK|nr:type II toxin-antitoxin system RelE/ParE family toxin [Duganella guangzhouensis]MRW92632.1 type II toxin-antitoxin system RelE/ParE family toxin [Duganella guangzhouensis]
MKPSYKPPFVTFVKKQRKQLQLVIEDAVEEVCANPDIGESKAGDLQGVWVYKFKHNRQDYLMAYRPPPSEELTAGEIDLLFIDFYQVGTHENFYAALKKYLKS